MYGIAYVILPTEFASLQAVLDEALAPFRRGGPDDFPREKFAFDDVADALKRLHAEATTLKSARDGLVSALLEAARRSEEHAFPTAVVLPVGACADAFRWFDVLGWRPIPTETKAFLPAPDDATFEEVTSAAWERFSDTAVAGVAYHF